MQLVDLVIVLVSGSRPTEGHDECARCAEPRCADCPLRRNA